MDPRREHELFLTRRQLFSRTATGIGTAALASLLEPSLFAQESSGRGILGAPHHRPTARRVIYLFPRRWECWRGRGIDDKECHLSRFH